MDCNPQQCPRDCSATEWSDWGDCRNSEGNACKNKDGKASQKRTRKISWVARDGGTRATCSRRTGAASTSTGAAAINESDLACERVCGRCGATSSTNCDGAATSAGPGHWDMHRPLANRFTTVQAPACLRYG